MVYKTLQTGNFYFPIDDMNQEFEVVDMYDFDITDEKAIKTFTTFQKVQNLRKTFKTIYLKELADLIWDKCKEELSEYKNKGYYIVPIMITYHKFKGKEYLSCTVDLLKKVRWYTKWLKKLRLLRN